MKEATFSQVSSIEFFISMDEFVYSPVEIYAEYLSAPMVTKPAHHEVCHRSDPYIFYTPDQAIQFVNEPNYDEAGISAYAWGMDPNYLWNSTQQSQYGVKGFFEMYGNPISAGDPFNDVTAYCSQTPLNFKLVFYPVAVNMIHT